MSTDRMKNQLKSACLSGDLQQAEALLQPSHAGCCRLSCLHSGTTTTQPDPLDLLSEPFPADGNNTALHYLAAGRGLGVVGALLWAASGGALGQVQPGRHDEQRALLLAWLLERWPGLLALLCSRNSAGHTPLHCCLNSASMETLRALMRGLWQLSPGSRHVVLALPFPSGGGTPLAFAIDRREWEAVQLLVQAGGHVLTHEYLAASQQVLTLLGRQPASSGGRHGAKGSRGASGGLAQAMAGAVKSTVGQLLGIVAGQAHEVHAVEEWRRQQRLQHAQQSAGGGTGSGSGAEAGAWGRSSLGNGGAVSSPASAGQAGVAVLQGTADLQRLREEQIARIAGVLGVSCPEAAALLTAQSWDELAVMQSHLGGSGSGGASRGKARGAAAVAESAAANDATPAGLASSRAEQPGCSSSGGSDYPALRRPAASTGVGLAAAMDLAWAGRTGVGPAGGTTHSHPISFRPNHHCIPGSSEAPPGQQPSASSEGSKDGGSSSGGDGNGNGSGSGGSRSQQAVQQCIVCYEDCCSGGVALDLPCRHPVCRTCWEGILMAQLDTGEVQRVVCPEPGCGLPLPIAAAEALLPPRDYQRYSQLLAHSFVDSNPTLRWCPRPGCSNVVRLLSYQGSAGSELRSAAAMGRGVDVQCACGHSFCWACCGDPHEPATCDQMRRWEEELATLREAAPGQDREWLARNTKRCPSCGMGIEKHGGCMHMTCRSCRHNWCWVCGRPWEQHSAETGGFYYCNLQARDDLPDFGQAAAAGQPAAGPGPLGWLRDAWGALQSVAAQRALQQQLRQFLRHDFNPGAATTLATHLQRLLLAAGVGCPPRVDLKGQHAQHASEGSGTRGIPLGPETLLGLTLGEAVGVGAAEWGQLVTAVADSLVDSGQLRAALGAGTGAAAEGRGAAAAGRHGEGRRGNGSRSRSGAGAGASGSGAAKSSSAWPACPAQALGAAELARLAVAVAAAHRCLQHAAVAAYSLGSFGPRRRYLEGLCDSLEASVVRLEGLLMAMPHREAALQCQQQHFRAASSWAEGGRRVSSWFGRLLHSLYNVRPSAAGSRERAQQGEQGQHAQQAQAQALEQEQRWVQECLSRGLKGEDLRQQLLFALAVHGQGQLVAAELAALEAGIQELRKAGRAGLFCPG